MQINVVSNKLMITFRTILEYKSMLNPSVSIQSYVILLLCKIIKLAKTIIFKVPSSKYRMSSIKPLKKSVVFSLENIPADFLISLFQNNS